MQRRYWGYLDNRTEKPHFIFLLIVLNIFPVNVLQTTKIISAILATTNLCKMKQLMKDKEEQLIRRYCDTYHLEEKNINYDMIIKHWNLERELRKKMLKCERSHRVDFFKDCYNILYASCPWLVSTGTAYDNHSASENWFINGNLPKNAQILEIGGGAGNCAKTVSEKGFF